MAYDFVEKTGIEATAKETGHFTQKIFNSPESLFGGIGSLINIILSFLGVIFFGLVFYGGWLWMTAQGDESKVEKAKKIVIGGIVGLIIVLSAYAISFLLVSSFSANNLN